MFARGDHVAAVEVCAAEDVKERHVSALSLVESTHLFPCHAFPRLDVLRPAVRAALEHGQRVKQRPGASSVQPPQEILKVRIYRQRLWLVDNPGPGAEFEDDDRPTSAMRISESAGGANERPQVAVSRER